MQRPQKRIRKLAPEGLAYSWRGGRGQGEVHLPSTTPGGMGGALGVRGEADLGLDAGRGHPSCTCRWRKREPGKLSDWETQVLPTENTHLPVGFLGNGCELPTSCEQGASCPGGAGIAPSLQNRGEYPSEDSWQ